MEAEKKLSQFVTDTRYDSLPRDAVQEIKNVVLNICGTVVAGSAREGCESLVNQVRDWGGKDEATILVHGGKVPAYNAAFVNAYMARALDIDDAMLSRFQKKVYVPLPDLAARSAIFMIETEGVGMAMDEDDFVELGVRSEGYSGRDISNVCQEVIMIPIRELDMSGLLEDSSKEVKVRDITIDDFKNTLKKVKPMTSDKALKQYQDWAEEYEEF